MLPYKLIDVIVSGSAHTFLQLFVLFKCIGVREERCRRPAFWLVLIYSLIFYFGADLIYLHPEFQSSLPLQTAHSLIHAVNTFIMLTIVGIYGCGYLPRNFLKMEIYYDVLSVIPFFPMYIVNGILTRIFLPSGLSDYTAYPASYLIESVCYVIHILEVIAVYYIFERIIDRLLQKIPDIICLIFFVLSFIGFVSKEIAMLKSGTYFFIKGPSIEYTDKCTFFCNLGLIHIGILVIVLLIFTGIHHRRLAHLQSIESSMLFDYYTNISTLYNSIRSLRHDLANHLTALSFMQNHAAADTNAAANPENNLSYPETGGLQAFAGSTDSHTPADTSTDSQYADSYRSSLLEICDKINREMQQQVAWQQIQTSLLSAREKYEIYHYMTAIMKKHRLPENTLSISAAVFGNNTEIKLAIKTGTESKDEQTHRPKHLHLLTLRHGMDFYMIKTIAQFHKGQADWKQNGSTFTLSLTLPEKN